MVKAAKRVLLGTFHTTGLTDEELVSTIASAEDLMNSRPLTYQSSHGGDLPPLTPNHFLMGQIGGRFAPDSVDTESFNPRSRWRQVQEVVKTFWDRWLSEWIPSLSPRRKWRQEYPDLKVRDVVLVLSSDLPRGKWPLGRITAVFPGADSHVRTADVRVGDTIYRRPLVKLCPLEVHNED